MPLVCVTERRPVLPQKKLERIRYDSVDSILPFSYLSFLDTNCTGLKRCQTGQNYESKLPLDDCTMRRHGCGEKRRKFKRSLVRIEAIISSRNFSSIMGQSLLFLATLYCRKAAPAKRLRFCIAIGMGANMTLAKRNCFNPNTPWKNRGRRLRSAVMWSLESTHIALASETDEGRVGPRRKGGMAS